MDNKKNVRFSGMGIYMIIVIIAAMFIMYVARMNTGTSNYTYNELVNDISKGKIESVSIRQNAEVPTGVVTVKVSGEQSVKSVYVSDVKDVEELLLDKNIEYTLKDVARQSVMLTTILPFGLSLLVIVFIMMMFTRQAGGGGNAKMMNFGKTKLGIRSFEFRGKEGFWLNGKKYRQFIGANRHQDFGRTPTSISTSTGVA